MQNIFTGVAHWLARKWLDFALYKSIIIIIIINCFCSGTHTYNIQQIFVPVSHLKNTNLLALSATKFFLWQVYQCYRGRVGVVATLRGECQTPVYLCTQKR